MTNYFTLQQIFCIPSQPFSLHAQRRWWSCSGRCSAAQLFLVKPTAMPRTHPQHVKVGERKRQPRCCHAPPQRGKESSKRVSCRAPLVVVGVAEPRGRLAWPPACLIDLTRRSSTPAALLLYTVRTSSPAATSTCLWLSALFLSPLFFFWLGEHEHVT